MKNLEENVVYVANHNGTVGGVYLYDLDTPNMSVAAFDRTFNVSGWRKEYTDIGVGLYQEGGAYFEFSDLVLDSVTTIFPDTKRTFKTLDNLASMVKKVIDMADSYEVNTEPEEVISFTVSTDGAVKALIKVESAGDLYTFDQGDWRLVDEDDDDPDIFELEVIDLEPEDIGEALELWKNSQTSGTPLTKEDMSPFAALTQ